MMSYRQAKRLSNGDTVIDKQTGKTIAVELVTVRPNHVTIRGVIDFCTRRTWQHRDIRTAN